MKILMIMNFYHLGKLRDLSHNCIDHKKLFFVGRIVPEKAPDDAINARDGLLVPPDGSTKLAYAIKKLAEYPAMIKKLLLNALYTMRESFCTSK